MQAGERKPGVRARGIRSLSMDDTTREGKREDKGKEQRAI